MARRVPRVAVLSLSLLLLALALARAPIGSTAGRVLREEETHRKDDYDDDTFFTLSRVERLKRREKHRRHRYRGSTAEPAAVRDEDGDFSLLSTAEGKEEEDKRTRRRERRQRREKERMERIRLKREMEGEEQEDAVSTKTSDDVKEGRRSNSSPDSPRSLPAVHILNLVAGAGLGQIVTALVPILEVLKQAGYETFGVHECGGEPPWKRGWHELVSCEDRPERHNLYHNFKRTYEIGGKQTLTEVTREYEKYERSNEVDHLNGLKNDWNEILSSKEIYGNASKMLMAQQMHNIFAKESGGCTSMRYWFDEPVGDLVEVVRKPESEMHKIITFHIRTFADENLGIAFNDDLTLNEELAEKRLNKGKAPDGRIGIVKKAASEFPKMVNKLVEFCTLLFEKTGKKTHVAVDSQTVRDFLRKHQSVVQVISTDIAKYKEHYHTEPAYTLNDVADWYLLSLGQTIVGFPSSSSFSGSARCRGDSELRHSSTESELIEIVHTVLENEFKEDIFTSETVLATTQTDANADREQNANYNSVDTDDRGNRDNDNGVEGDASVKLSDIPFPSPPDSKFRFHETSSGVRTCLPGVPAEYSDVLTADTASGSTISPEECLWFNEVNSAGIAASKLPSDCVPDETVYSSHANEYHWDMLMFDLQNLKDRECFMNRLLIECMDDKALELCKASPFIKHCIPYPKSMRASDFEHPEGQTESKTDYNALTWIKSKVAFSLMHANLSVFIFDSDVIFFDVPDLVEIQATKPDGIIFFQLASIEDEEAEKDGKFTKEYHSHEDFNTGQLFWKPSGDMKRILLEAFRSGNERHMITRLDQAVIANVLRDDPDGLWDKAHHLSSKFDSGCFHHRPYDEEKRLKRTTFHACCSSTLSEKLHALNTAQNYFLEHIKEREQMLSKQYIAGEKPTPSEVPPTPEVNDKIRSSDAVDASVNDLISSNSGSKCMNGYPSTNEETTCICNTDWIGERCEVDPIPSCDRNVHLSCGDVLYRFAHSQEEPGMNRTEFPPCQCADECATHLLNAYGDSMYKHTFSDHYSRFDQNLHLCTDNNKVKHTLFWEMDYEERKLKREEMGEVSEFDAQEDSRKLMTKLVDSREQKATNCSPDCERFGGGCIDYECVMCKEGRFGMDCAMSKDELDSARLNAPIRKGKKELSLSYLDLPGTIRRFIRGQRYQNNGSFRGVHFFEHSLRKDAEVFDPNPPTSESSDEELENTVTLIPFFPSDTVGNVGMAQIYASRVEKYVNEKFKGDISFPTVWFNAQDRGFCTTQKSRDALPPNGIAITQYGQWRGHPNEETPCFRSETDIVIPSSVTSLGGYYGANDPEFKRYDEKTKDGFLLFFAGSERTQSECLGEEFFKNLKNNCMYSYGGGARGWIVDWFKDEERFWLNRKLTRSVERGDAAQQAEVIRMHSKFCLSAGGNGFDQRFIDGISRGCVPVLTQINTSHPFEFLLNYESFTIRTPGEKMRNLPEILEDAVSSGKYAKMLVNLRVVREAMAWNVTNGREGNDEYDTFTVNNGAYYHTLAAIALRTNKELPEIATEKLCKLYFHNEYHEYAWRDVLSDEFRRVLEPRCENKSSRVDE